MNFKTSRIINSNGQRYRVGWDEHGWFSIQMVEENPFYGEGEDAGPQWIASTDNPTTSFTPSGVEKLKEAIEDR